MVKRIAIGTVLSVCFALPAMAQQSLSCSDFQRNADGSWSALRPVALNGVSFGPGVAFREGVAFGGVDLAKLLNQQCR